MIYLIVEDLTKRWTKKVDNWAEIQFLTCFVAGIEIVNVCAKVKANKTVKSTNDKSFFTNTTPFKGDYNSILPYLRHNKKPRVKNPG